MSLQLPKAPQLPNNHLAEQLVQFCKSSGWHLAIAESLTGGLLSAKLVEIPSASKVFIGSVVAYSSNLKRELLDVDEQILKEHGAVSAEVARQMANGVRKRLSAAEGIAIEQVIGLATTGVAGPDKQDGAPVGRVYIGISSAKLPQGSIVVELALSGDRNQIREQAANAALLNLWEHLQ